MKKTEFCLLLGEIDEAYIREAHAPKQKKPAFLKQYGVLAACLALVFAVTLGALLGYAEPKSPPATTLLHMSWAYRYENLRELTEASDLIARVEIRKGGSADDWLKTIYTATVHTPIYGSSPNETIELVFWGGLRDGIFYEVADDPLPTVGEEFVIFAKKHDDGAYAILGGPQGRMCVEDELVSSLSVFGVALDHVPWDAFLEEVSSYLS